MTFQLPTLRKPDFLDAKFIDCENVTVKEVEKDGVAPTGFYLTSHMPTFYRVQDRWLLPRHSSLNCVAVLEGDQIIIHNSGKAYTYEIRQVFQTSPTNLNILKRAYDHDWLTLITCSQYDAQKESYLSRTVVVALRVE